MLEGTLNSRPTLIIHGPGVAIGFYHRAQPLQLRIVQRVPVENELGELALRLEAVAPQRFLDEAVDARHELLLGGPALREQLRKEALALHLPQAVIRMAHPGYEATWAGRVTVCDGKNVVAAAEAAAATAAAAAVA